MSDKTTLKLFFKVWVLLVLLLGLILIQIYTPVCAGISCNTDMFGNLTCVGTGEDSGYQAHGETDMFGNHRYEDNQGNVLDCSSDMFGNTNCQ